VACLDGGDDKENTRSDEHDAACYTAELAEPFDDAAGACPHLPEFEVTAELSFHAS